MLTSVPRSFLTTEAGPTPPRQPLLVFRRLGGQSGVSGLPGPWSLASTAQRSHQARGGLIAGAQSLPRTVTRALTAVIYEGPRQSGTRSIAYYLT